MIVQDGFNCRIIVLETPLHLELKNDSIRWHIIWHVNSTAVPFHSTSTSSVVWKTIQPEVPVTNLRPDLLLHMLVVWADKFWQREKKIYLLFLSQSCSETERNACDFNKVIIDKQRHHKLTKNAKFRLRTVASLSGLQPSYEIQATPHAHANYIKGRSNNITHVTWNVVLVGAQKSSESCVT